MSAKKILRAVAVTGLLALGTVAVAATPAQAAISGCSAEANDVSNYAQATCTSVTTPSKFRAIALCESDSTGQRQNKYGAWHYVSHQTAITYCWSGWTIVSASVGTA